MALNFTGHKPHEEREFVPSAFDNKSSSTPVRVYIRTPTERDKREVEGDGSVIRFAVDSDGAPLKDKDGNPLMEIDNQETMRRHHIAVERFVARVENCTGPAGPIVTGADFATYAPTAIVTEVYREVMSALSLTESEAKKSEGSPSFCSVAIQASGGTVVPA
jgi:hypothetical protein